MFRVRDIHGNFHDIELQECSWYRVDGNGLKIDVKLRDGTPARGVLSQDQFRQIRGLDWLHSARPDWDYYWEVFIPAYKTGLVDIDDDDNAVQRWLRAA